MTFQDSADPDEGRRGTYGAGYMLGLSYDWFPSHRERSGGWSVSPILQAKALPDSSASTFLVLIGVELGYWAGLPANQLELPESEAYKRH